MSNIPVDIKILVASGYKTGETGDVVGDCIYVNSVHRRAAIQRLS